MSSNEEEAAGQEASGATQADEAPQAAGERAGDRRPPVATRFKPGQSGNPRGRPRVKRHLGAVVARALRERVTVEETDGRVRRLSKLEATVKQIVDGATKGDARATRLLFALIKADERALNEPEGGRPEGLQSEADAIVIAELRRRFAAGDWLSRAQRSGADPTPDPSAARERGEAFPGCGRGRRAGAGRMRGRAAPRPGPLPQAGEGDRHALILPSGPPSSNGRRAAAILSPSGGRWTREARPDEGRAGLTPAEVETALRNDFYSFLLHAFVDRHGAAAFVPGWHIEVMAARLAAVREGGARRLIVNIPPRHLKSLAASIALPAWLLGHDPTLAIVNATYAQDLSDAFARDCRALMASSWYRALFPTRLRAARPPLRELITTRGGFRMATSVGGVLTGRGADVILIDDPLKPADAMSESRRTGANAWFDGTLYSRLNDKTKGSIVIVMQRLHEDDLVGHVLKAEGWEIVAFPAIAEAGETHEIETPFGRKAFARQAGEALHGERELLATLERIRTTIGEANFAGQYQQRPAPAGGGMIRETWFPRFSEAERPAFERIIQSWDTANKPTELADYSVCTTWGLKGPNAYLVNVFRKRLAFPDLERAVIDQDALFSPEVVLIEDRASGTQLIQALIEKGLSRVTRYAPDGDKIMRLHAQTATIENGFVWLPREAPWLAGYLRELSCSPPAGATTRSNSTAQALAWIKSRPRAHGMAEHSRRMVGGAVGAVRLMR